MSRRSSTGVVVPAGASGELTIEFAPDGPYRWGLLLGALLAVALVLLATWPDRSRRQLAAAPLRAHRERRRVLSVVVAGLVCGLVAATIGLGDGLLAGGVAASGKIPRHARLVAVVALAVVAAATQAWLAPGRVGGSGLEGTVRLVVLAALVLALAGQKSADEA